MLSTLAGVVLATAVATSAAARDPRPNTNPSGATYEVTIANASSLRFTPLLVTAHSDDIALFQVGDSPSPELAEMAEGGSIAGLLSVLDSASAFVGDVATTDGLLEPAQSVTLTLETVKPFVRLSIAAMLLPTNDSFVGLQSVPLPSRRGQTVRYAAVGYDAGSEPNDELCANIPGPPCGGAGVSPDEGGEGYVRVSPGIVGDADVSPRAYDWRNPVAIVTVTRVQ